MLPSSNSSKTSSKTQIPDSNSCGVLLFLVNRDQPGCIDIHSFIEKSLFYFICVLYKLLPPNCCTAPQHLTSPLIKHQYTTVFPNLSFAKIDVNQRNTYLLCIVKLSFCDIHHSKMTPLSASAC